MTEPTEPSPPTQPPGLAPEGSVHGVAGGLEDQVDLVLVGRVLTDDGVVLRRVVVSGGRVVTIESVSDWSDTDSM
ncbi:MAG: hypothetical protein EOP01_05100, partial [Propionibacteriaceae bacterium]